VTHTVLVSVQSADNTVHVRCERGLDLRGQHEAQAWQLYAFHLQGELERWEEWAEHCAHELAELKAFVGAALELRQAK